MDGVRQEEALNEVASIFGVTRNNVDQIKARMTKELKKRALLYAGIGGA